MQGLPRWILRAGAPKEETAQSKFKSPIGILSRLVVSHHGASSWEHSASSVLLYFLYPGSNPDLNLTPSPMVFCNPAKSSFAYIWNTMILCSGSPCPAHPARTAGKTQQAVTVEYAHKPGTQTAATMGNSLRKGSFLRFQALTLMLCGKVSAASQTSCVCNPVCQWVICSSSQSQNWFIRDMNFHCLEPGIGGKRQGPETWFPSEIMGKLIKAVTQQTVLMKLRGPARHHAILVTGHQAGGFIGDCLRNVL